MTTLEIVEQGTILRATVGSTVRGLHHGGQDDRDEMAVFIEPPEYLIGLRLAKPPRHVPVWLALLAGEPGVVMGTDARGASNAKAKRELGWTPRYPSWRKGFASAYSAIEVAEGVPRVSAGTSYSAG